MPASVDLDEAVAVLSRTPSVVRSLLADLPEEWAGFRVEDTSWTPYDVLGHLIHGERTDWLPRIRMILEHGPAQPFTPFDREAMLGADDDVAALLDAWAARCRPRC